MASRDEKGNYVNDKGVVIKLSEYSDGSGVKIDFYDKNPSDEGHKSIHTHINNDGTYKTEDNANGGPVEKTSGSCYLTSACMKHFQENFDDDCYELRVLRWFRDNFVSPEDIKHYYTVAPYIVKEINKDEKADLVYDYIYDNIVDYCVEQIVDGNYDNAYKRYKNSILALEEQFVPDAVRKQPVDTIRKTRTSHV